MIVTAFWSVGSEGVAEFLTALAALLVALTGVAALVVRSLRRPPSPPREPQAHSSRSFRRVLVVEDDHTTADVIQDLLEDEIPSVMVEVVHSGADALVSLNERPCDLLILDVCMSGVSGPEVVEHLRKTWPARATPVLLYSGLDREALEAVREGCGADAAVEKGGVDDRLMPTVRRLLGLEGGPTTSPQTSSARRALPGE